MTAVVGILNKQAVAIAADSAVTVTTPNGRKIFNKANKVFALSYYHPVGIMIYNSASFMSIPWETIIKMYRKHLDKKSFPKIREYQEDFVNYLHSKDFFITPEIQIHFLDSFINNFINSAISEVINKNSDILSNPTNENKEKFYLLFSTRINDIISLWSTKTELCNEFSNYTFEEFNDYTNQIFTRNINLLFTKNSLDVSEELLELIKKSVYFVLIAQEELTNFTGLVFTGFGEEEIYPQLIPINVSMVFNDKLRYYVKESHIASILHNSLGGAVCPFAQTDVIDTIITGVDPTIDFQYLENFKNIFEKYNQEILNLIENSNSLLHYQIKNINLQLIIDEYIKINNQFKNEKYIYPLLSAVGNLSKEDLAEMAESLIYLTYLKRRMTSEEESVGGPVDVAIISKGDGLVWIKRKHYFSPELNQHFFKNYFKEQ